MNKQEVIQEITNLAFPNLDTVPDILKLSDVIKILNQLTEPQKVVIPKWVADCIDYAKEQGCTLYQTLGFTFYKDFAEDYVVYTKEWAEWLVVPKNQETLARAWLDGYTIEQEKLYTVEIPNPNEDEFLTALAKAFDGKVFIDRTANVNWRYHKQFQLTESEIRKDFDWAWQAGFAKEVE